MNKSYMSFFRYRNPFRFITSIFRNYKKCCEKIKRNQSEPTVVTGQKRSVSPNKPKSEVNLCSAAKAARETHADQFSDRNFSNGSSQEIKVTYSNSKFDRTSSTISLKKKKCHIDLNLKDKLETLPTGRCPSLDGSDISSRPRIPQKRAYPWQNFNLANVRKPKYEHVRSVNDLTSEMLNLRKSILRKTESKSSSECTPKEVKFNDTTSMAIYPNKSYMMKRAKINPSPKTMDDKDTFSRKKRTIIKSTSKIKQLKVGYTRHPFGYHRKNIRKLKKCLPVERQGNFWYLNNKKERIY